MVVSLDMARRIGKAAIKKAQEMNRLCSVAVVDDRGIPIIIYRMDHTPSPTADIAYDKAWTAASFGMPSSDIVKLGNPSCPGFGFNTENYNYRLTPIAGGLPIKDGDEVTGGIGVSGATPEEDVAIAQAGIAALSAIVR